jgi:hypothetical protein
MREEQLFLMAECLFLLAKRLMLLKEPKLSSSERHTSNTELPWLESMRLVVEPERLGRSQRSVGGLPSCRPTPLIGKGAIFSDGR